MKWPSASAATLVGCLVLWEGEFPVDSAINRSGYELVQEVRVEVCRETEDSPVSRVVVKERLRRAGQSAPYWSTSAQVWATPTPPPSGEDASPF